MLYIIVIYIGTINPMYEKNVFVLFFLLLFVKQKLSSLYFLFFNNFLFYLSSNKCKQDAKKVFREVWLQYYNQNYSM
jgi:hypothetical protein